MSPIRVLVALCLFACAACIDLPEVVDPPNEPLPVPPLEVRLASPGEATHHTNGDVPVQVVVSGGEAETVELLLGEEVLASLSPPYSYTWATQGVPEGRYSLVARAWRQGEGFTSVARAVVVDRTPPRVVARLPAPGAQDVSVRAPIRIEFSEPLLASSVTEASFSVTAGGAVMGSAMALAADSQSVEISLEQVPPVPTDFMVTVSPLLTDAAGNLIAVPAGGWSWHTPAFIPVGTRLHAGDGLDVSSTLSVAMDSSTGAPVLAWSEKAGAFGNDIFVRRWSGSEWLDLGMVPRLQDTSTRLQPQLRLKNDGQLLVGFIDYGEDHSPRVVVAEYSGGAWQVLGMPFRCIPPDGGVSGFTMALGPDQQPVVALSDFYPSDPTEGRVYVCRFRAGNWEAVGAPLGTVGSQGQASLSGLEVDAVGNPVVLWREGAAFYLEKWNGTAWMRRGQDIRASSGASLANASLAMSQDGVPYIAWTVNDANAFRRVYAARDTAANHIGSAVLASNPQVSVIAPLLKVGEQGRPVVFWRAHDNSNARSTFQMMRWLGSQWEESMVVTTLPSGAGGGAFAVDAQGEILCAHPEYDGARNVIALKRFNR